MPNAIKYSASAQTLALKKGSMYIGVGDVGKGPSSSTGYYNGVNIPSGGYAIYSYDANLTGNLSYFTAATDSQLISYTNRVAGTSYTTVNECLSYFGGQSNKFVVNSDYEAITTNGLIYMVDYGYIPSYPKNNTTSYDLGTQQSVGTTLNSPSFTSSSNIGYYNFNGNGTVLFSSSQKRVDYGTSTAMSTLNDSDFTIEVWANQVNSIAGNYGFGNFFQWGYEASTYLPFVVGGIADVSNYVFEVQDASGNGFLMNPKLANSTMVNAGWNLFTMICKKVNGWYNGYFYLNGSAYTTVDYYRVTNGAYSSLLTPPITNTFSSYNFTSQTSKKINIGTLIVSNGAGVPWPGYVSTSRVYNRVLTDSEITNNYNVSKTKYGR